MKNAKLIYLIIFSSCLFFVACEKENLEVETSLQTPLVKEKLAVNSDKDILNPIVGIPETDDFTAQKRNNPEPAGLLSGTDKDEAHLVYLN